MALGAPIVEVRGLITKIGGQTIHDGLDLTVTKGEILGLVGASGSGKSVLLQVLIGLRRPSSGLIRICGRNPGCAVPNRGPFFRP
jgi:phospholipid/cholesterol/gamma-HCH transport system ATP-binding protein